MCLTPLPAADNASYTRIYTAISAWWAARARLPDAVGALLPKLVGATLALYADLRRQLLPTPAKSHYVYNMRDLSKVFQVSRRFGLTSFRLQGDVMMTYTPCVAVAGPELFTRVRFWR